MSYVAVRVENLSKKYRRGARRGYRDVPELLLKGAQEGVRWVKDRAGRLLSPGNGRTAELGKHEFWALQDVSFDIGSGEVLGIIGCNGAGKSTLLKLLSRVTQPTQGEIGLRGRVGSLLEVGTGFHPELTGRENILVNGTILGMKRAEIKRNFDAIVDFSGVEKFLDTPVKHYSSGMYVRLAFAVAAHLQPEILIVDEVLAVGDVAFQKKCLGKMGDVARGGRTVLMVSHNMASILQLCNSCLWLHDGQVSQIGKSSEVVSEYLRLFDSAQGTAECSFPEQPEKEAQVRKARVRNAQGETTQSFDCDEPVLVELLFQVHERIPGLYGYLSINKPDGTVVLVSDSFDSPPNVLDDLDVGMHRILITMPPRSLGHGDYVVYLNLTSDRARNWNVDSPGIVAHFTLTDNSSRRGNGRPGYLSTLLSWHASDASHAEV